MNRSRLAVRSTPIFGVALRCIVLLAVCVLLLVTNTREGNAEVETADSLPAEESHITREYTFAPGDNEPDFEERIVDEDGTAYLLKEVGSPLPNFGAAVERYFTLEAIKPISVEMKDQGDAAVRTVFANTLTVDADEFAGILRLQDIAYEPVYRSTEQQVERTVVYPGLPSEDVAQLPDSADFTVSDDASTDATVDRTLRRLAVTWETTEVDSAGRPTTYQATVIYRGVERELLLDYYRVTASYTGMLPAKPVSHTVRATYEASPELPVREAPIFPRVGTLNIPATATPLAAAPNYLPFILISATAVVMVLALLFLLYFFLYKNARLVRVLHSGKRRVLERRHLRMEQGKLIFRIDPSHLIYRKDAHHEIVLNARLADRQGQLVVLWGDKMVMRTEIKRETDITEELVKALGEQWASIADEASDFVPLNRLGVQE